MISRLTALGLLLLTYSMTSSADTVKRMDGESTEEFVLRVSPAATELVHPIIATKEWTPGKVALIAFVQHEYPPPNNDPNLYSWLVTGYLFIPMSAQAYERIEIDTYGPEGRSAQIDTVFFERTAQNGARSLFVLVSWSPNGGSLYRTYAYAPHGLVKPIFLEELGLKIDGGCIYCRKDFMQAAQARAMVRKLVAQQSH